MRKFTHVRRLPESTETPHRTAPTFGVVWLGLVRNPIELLHRTGTRRCGKSKHRTDNPLPHRTDIEAHKTKRKTTDTNRNIMFNYP